MYSWVDGIKNALNYIEDNITEEMNIRDISSIAYVSEFHFQRIFNALCGFTVSEYIRNRRLTLAAQELSATDAKVIDVAVKYGYFSPDSFTRAFTKFHGISPSAAKEKGARLNSFAPLVIKLTLEGGTMTEYRIVEKAAFTIMGVSKKFSNENAYEMIPKFWQEYMMAGDNRVVCGMFGVCVDNDGSNFDYFIADNYNPCMEIPDGYKTQSFPAGTWAVFPCKGAHPEALQKVNTKIWNEWLPNCKEYKLGGNYNIEMYTPPCKNPEDDYSEIWVPVEKI